MSIHSEGAPARDDDTSGKSDKPEKRDKRERILAAAESIFARRGFYNARVSEIAREAGVADGTIYLYFKNKDDLLYSVFETRMERVNHALAAAVAGSSDPREQLRAFVHTYLTLVAEEPEAAEVLTVELRQSSKFMKEYANPRFGEFLKILAGVIAAGQERGQFAAGAPPSLLARGIFGMLDELALAWLLGGKDKFDIAGATEWIGTFTLAGLERSKS